MPDFSAFGRKIRTAVLSQLRQGITVEKLAISLALGLVLGIFPILGMTTMLCFVAAAAFGLNQPVTQLVNYLAYPLQIPLMFFFVRLGEWIYGAQPATFSVARLVELFHESPWGLLQQFGLTGLHGITGWLLVAPAISVLVYYGFLSALRRLRLSFTGRRPVSMGEP